MAKPKSTLHKLRISQRHRTGTIWSYFNWLYGVWKDRGCPDAYDFRNYLMLVDGIDQIEGIRTYRFENMVKTFRLQIEQDHLDMLNAKRERSAETIQQISMFKSVNQQQQRQTDYDNAIRYCQEQEQRRPVQPVQHQAPNTSSNWWDDIPDAKEPDRSVIWY